MLCKEKLAPVAKQEQPVVVAVQACDPVCTLDGASSHSLAMHKDGGYGGDCTIECGYVGICTSSDAQPGAAGFGFVNGACCLCMPEIEQACCCNRLASTICRAYC
jgi:hypothetical protein